VDAVGWCFGEARSDRSWYLLTMSGSEYVVGRRAGTNGQPVGERHAVVAVATRKDAPFRAECGVKVDVVDGNWPPEGGEDRACPVCARDTSAPWG
jgi:hypothetical protein